MRLSDLIDTGALSGEDARITGFSIDHRKVIPGHIFGAFQGARVNGEDFIPQAIAAGAVGVVARADAQVNGAVHLAAVEPRRAFAEMAARFYAPFPEVLAAVTGTNGKTSTVELTRQLWNLAGHKAASIGTLGITTADNQLVTGLTTPDITTFLMNMAALFQEGVSHVAFEASSHGLSQYRSEGVALKAVGFTNLSRDHLDYHETMEAYLAAKLRLFTEIAPPASTAVIWADDQASQAVIAAAQERGLQLFSVGAAGNGLKLVDRVPTHQGQTLTLEASGAQFVVSLPLIGAYQAANALVAAGLVIATGGSVEGTVDNLQHLQPVRGRLELAVLTQSGAPVYVDYAHTADGLRAAIEALRPHCSGRLITVFGAGGDRDKGKRPEMARVAAALSDSVIVTDDNPRTEDPATIRAEVLSGAPGMAIEVPNRRDAIARAIGMAEAKDIVLIAGKGHEQGQIVGEIVMPFDDVQVARECAA